MASLGDIAWGSTLCTGFGDMTCVCTGFGDMACVCTGYGDTACGSTLYPGFGYSEAFY
jgi:hypothetical protein